MNWLVSILMFCTVASHAATILVTNELARAVASARPGDTLLVAGPGPYREHITITNAIRLVGTNQPVIDAGGIGTPLTIAAPNVEVHGITIRNSGVDLTTFDSGVMILSNHARITACRTENDSFGIYIRGASFCQIEKNDIVGTAEQPPSKRGNGIHLWKTRGNKIEGNQVQAKRDGMYFSFADGNLIAGNQISETRFGIHYMYSHQNRLLSNTLAGNTVGATLMFSRDSEISGNRVRANKRHGILFKQVDRSTVAGNVVVGHNRGFFIQQATQNRFSQNTIATNDIGVYMSNGSEQNLFVANDFLGNTDHVWQPADEVSAGRLASNQFCDKNCGNFWSDYTGADRNHDGIGDAPYHETDVFGYIVERHPDARALAFSPAVALLRKGEELLPVLEAPGITDLHPLMAPAAGRRASRTSPMAWRRAP